jgi:hypothetical protein
MFIMFVVTEKVMYLFIYISLLRNGGILVIVNVGFRNIFGFN